MIYHQMIIYIYSLPPPILSIKCLVKYVIKISSSTFKSLKDKQNPLNETSKQGRQKKKLMNVLAPKIGICKA